MRKPKYVLFDTETTGLKNKYQAMGHKSQPKIVQLAAILADEELNELSSMNVIVAPNGRYERDESHHSGYAPKSFAAHGITYTRAETEGVTTQLALGMFQQMCELAQVYICHNTEYDEFVVQSEAISVDVGLELPAKGFCSMKNTTQICKIPGNYGFKWPTLTELHTFLFGVGFDKAHNALYDIRATMKCLVELRRRELLVIP